MNPQPSIARPKESPDYFSNCTHCGFCLAVCPTYKLTGDENNSPRGRLRLWSEEAAGRLPRDPWTDHYTSECVGCLACEPACPATVPYGEIFERVRHEHVAARRATPALSLRLAAAAVAHPALFGAALLPARVLRRAGYSPWWVLLVLVPLVNLVALWVFAYRRWPAIDGVAPPRD